MGFGGLGGVWYRIILAQKFDFVRVFLYSVHPPKVLFSVIITPLVLVVYHTIGAFV